MIRPIECIFSVNSVSEMLTISLVFGAEFDYKLELDEYEIKPNWHYLNPLAYDNPATAFDAGLTGGAC